MGKYKEAEAVFAVLDSRHKFPFRLSDELEAARANLYLMKKDYSKALEPLSALTAAIKRHKKENRYHFIMAQIYEHQKNYSEAVVHYKKSLKGRPRYDMQFAALMGIARIGSNSQSIPASEIKKMLTKLSNDNKNKDFFDQVHYYLAELCLSEGNKKCAIEHLTKSIQASTNNNRQKAQSHLKLANLYFDEEKYRPAQENYAAAIALLDTKYPGYNEYKQRSEVLTELIRHLDIIYEQDSLQRIAQMPEKERNKFIDDILFKKEKEEKEAREKAQQLPSTPAEKSRPQEEVSGGSRTDWYFYNASLKSNGYNEFIRVWGNRKLEDNWRRSVKSVSVFDVAATATDTSKKEEAATAATGRFSDREMLLNKFPITKEAREKSDQMLINALYEAATIYKSKLNNNRKAIETFEELLKRYPDNKFRAQVYYNLYLLYQQEGNIARSDYYKNQLLTAHPDSPFAKVILDPEYLSKQHKKNTRLEDYYKTTFGYYQRGAYDTVIMMVSAADSLFTENALRPKFALLHAFALGKTKDLKTYKEALSSIIEQYPGDEVKNKAEEILNLLENSETKEVRLQSNVADFDYMPNDVHYFMITFSNKDIKVAELINIIAQYNDINRSLEDLKVNSLILKDDITMVVVKSFRNLAMANDYASAIVSSGSFGSYQPGDLRFSIVSENNFNVIVKQRDVEPYLVFYEARYTKHAK
jgi:tetratricopeptide (TPR) repeat protein